MIRKCFKPKANHRTAASRMLRKLAFLPQLLKTQVFVLCSQGIKGVLTWLRVKEGKTFQHLQFQLKINKQPRLPEDQAANHSLGAQAGRQGQHTVIYICNPIWMGKAHENKLIILKL